MLAEVSRDAAATALAIALQFNAPPKSWNHFAPSTQFETVLSRLPLPVTVG